MAQQEERTRKPVKLGRGAHTHTHTPTTCSPNAPSTSHHATTSASILRHAHDEV